jgi:hypothetical protein
MNYNSKKVLFLPLSPSQNMGYMVGTIGGKQLAMKNFSVIFDLFFLTFYPYHTI